jgi:2-dehydro-3-deoxygalactonokinase
MRGEETELMGLFARGRWADVAQDGLVVVPGTHSKHVVVQRHQVTDFRTYMTGELFDALAAHTVLAASVGGPVAAETPLSDPPNLTAFREAVQLSAEGGLARVLFKVRSRGLLLAADPASNRHGLRGMLIGAELSDLVETRRTTRIGSRVAFVPPADVALAAVRGQEVLLSTRTRS